MALLWSSVVSSWLVIVGYTSVTSQNIHAGMSASRYMRLRDGCEELWFDQKLDHSVNISTTWKQRYYANLTRFQEGGSNPIFLMIGGEVPETALEGGYWDILADKFGAVKFELEHRFYGSSIPNQDVSTKNLRYLSFEEALGDLAYFIVSMNNKHGFTSNNKWVVFGGSYPGMLAAWARLKFPNLVHAAVSSSAPVLLELSFKEYNEVVRTVLAMKDKQCAENVHDAALQLAKLLPNPGSKEMLMEKFGACEYDPGNKNDVVSFLSVAALSIDSTVQYNRYDAVCNVMLDDGVGDLIHRYGKLFKLLNPGPSCIPVGYNDRQISPLLPTGEESSRMWIYQRCTELGGFPTSSTSDELFGSLIDLQFFVGICQDAFGSDFNLERLAKGTENAGKEYGGLNITDNVSRVVFVQGSIDPLHPQGVCNSTNPLAPAIMIQGTAHCGDMDSPSDHDIQPLVDARRRIENYIQEWLV